MLIRESKMRIIPSSYSVSASITVATDGDSRGVRDCAVPRVCDVGSVADKFVIIHLTDGLSRAIGNDVAMKISYMVPVRIIKPSIVVPTGKLSRAQFPKWFHRGIKYERVLSN